MTWGLATATVRFGTRVAIDNLSFDVNRSAVTVIVGGDGAGKSTALRALVGLVRLDAGQARRPAKGDIGYIPATGGIYLDLTVEENLAFSGGAYGLIGHDLAHRMSDIVERVGLQEARSRLGGHLSGGMRRKLAVAVALLHRPGLLVLDEPTTGVDPVSRAQLWRLISGEAASGTAVVVSTTYVNEAQRATSVILMERGRAVASGTPDDVIAAVPGAIGVVRSGAQPRVNPGDGARRGGSGRPTGTSRRMPKLARQTSTMPSSSPSSNLSGSRRTTMDLSACPFRHGAVRRFHRRGLGEPVGSVRRRGWPSGRERRWQDHVAFDVARASATCRWKRAAL